MKDIFWKTVNNRKSQNVQRRLCERSGDTGSSIPNVSWLLYFYPHFLTSEGTKLTPFICSKAFWPEPCLDRDAPIMMLSSACWIWYVILRWCILESEQDLHFTFGVIHKKAEETCMKLLVLRWLSLLLCFAEPKRHECQAQHEECWETSRRNNAGRSAVQHD